MRQTRRDSQACLNRISAPPTVLSIPGPCIHECIRQNRQAKTHRRPHSSPTFFKSHKRITTVVVITDRPDYDNLEKINQNKLHRNQTLLIFFTPLTKALENMSPNCPHSNYTCGLNINFDLQLLGWESQSRILVYYKKPSRNRPQGQPQPWPHFRIGFKHETKDQAPWESTHRNNLTDLYLGNMSKLYE